jgi:hypothetical protein
VDIPLRLAVIGWDGASGVALRIVIDADIVGAFTRRAPRARRSGARPRLAHRGPLSLNKQDGLYLNTAWRRCTDMQYPNQHRR